MMRIPFVVLLMIWLLNSCDEAVPEPDVPDQLILPPTTYIIDKDKGQLLTYFDSITVAIQSSADFVDSIEVGDIIVSGEQPIAANGFLRKVVGIDDTSVNGQVQFLTETAKLTEAIQQGSLRLSGSASQDSIQVIVADGAQLIPGKTADEIAIAIDRNLYESGSSVFKLTGTLRTTPEYTFELDIEDFDLKYLKSSIDLTNGQVELSLSANAQLQFQKQVELFRALVTRRGTLIGGVFPVWVSFHFVVYANFSAGAEGEITIGAEMDFVSANSINFNGTTWDNQSTFNNSAIRPSPVSASVELNASGGLEPAVQVSLYDQEGVSTQLGVEGGFRVVMDLSTSSIECNSFFDANLKGNINLELIAKGVVPSFSDPLFTTTVHEDFCCDSTFDVVLNFDETNFTETATVTPGLPTYDYSWSTGVVDSNTSSVTNMVTINDAGVYAVTVTDLTGCPVTASDTIECYLAVSTTASGNDASVVVDTAGYEPYAYSWSTGDNSESVTGLASGVTHTVTVTDHLNCTATASAVINCDTAFNVIVTASSQDREVAAFTNGGQKPYSYAWSSGQSTSNTNDPANIISINSGGTYLVTVTDALGCTVSAEDMMPCDITVNASLSGTDATATATSSFLPITYAWSNGVTGPSNPGLSSGNYGVTATDDLQCTATASVSVGGCMYGSVMDSRDGQTYQTVTIGSQTWFAENLNYTTPNSYCYDNLAANCDIYGRLYRWDDALTACPSGWHLPSFNEWFTLIEEINGNPGDVSATMLSGFVYFGGGKLKSATLWDTPNTGATDEFCFSAVGAGFGDYEIGYPISSSNKGEYAFFWTSSQDNIDQYKYPNTDAAWVFALENDVEEVYLDFLDWEENAIDSAGELGSCRCVMD